MGQHLVKCQKCPLVVKNEVKSCDQTSPVASNISSLATAAEENTESSFSSDQAISVDFTEDKQRHLSKLLSKAIYVTGTPLSMVEHPLWKELFNEIQPLFQLPTRKAVSSTHLESIYNEMEREITEELKSTNHLHLQCDGWSNRRNEGVINFVIAKPEPIFVKSLATNSNRHTGEYLSVEIQEVMRTYGTHKFVTLIGDNAKNIIGEKGSGEQLKLPSKTRWGSYYHAVRSLQNSKAALQCLAVHEEATMIPEDAKANLLNEEFWKMTDESTALLEPITEKIFQLEGNKAHFHEVFMAFKDIESRLAFLLPGFTSLVDQNTRERILNAVKMRRNNCVKPIHLAAYMLDPKTQGIELNEDEEISAMDFISEKGRQLNLDVMTDLANYRAREGLWAKTFVWSSLQNMSALTWWKGICKNKPLSKVALCLLTAPCTSAATERTFSVHGNIHSIKRNRLTTERAAKLAYISYNWNLLHNKKDEEEEDDDLFSSPLDASPLTSPTFDYDEPQPSTSGNSYRDIEFLTVPDVSDTESD
ncbi:hypothetical protein ABMA28_014340 [Loxostege sticticalis]|uniref:Transposase n=1 Tax=Loxostege sticticalis TaxID=481309 RepID=A0ABD0TGD9_LOXSC